jgi:hypothetical protein
MRFEESNKLQVWLLPVDLYAYRTLVRGIARKRRNDPVRSRNLDGKIGGKADLAKGAHGFGPTRDLIHSAERGH